MWTAMVSAEGTGAAGSPVNVEINASHIMDRETLAITVWFRVRTRTVFSRSRTVFAYRRSRPARHPGHGRALHTARGDRKEVATQAGALEAIIPEASKWIFEAGGGSDGDEALDDPGKGPRARVRGAGRDAGPTAGRRRRAGRQTRRRPDGPRRWRRPACRRP